jgi:phospholipid/cholesterol/gamma-HCH transport system ATP-binding protein
VLAVICELKPRDGAPLVVFGAEVATLPAAERQRLLRRIGFVPANGGLLSNLNGWENISLPIAYHAPQKLEGALEAVHALLEELGGVDAGFLAKLPDEMTLYERRLAAYIRALLEGPDLLVVDNAGVGLGPTKRRRANRFAEVYRARCPGGTYVEFDG